MYERLTSRLDRFGPLLGLAVLTVVMLSLVDRRTDDSDWAAIMSTFAMLLVGLTLLLALGASGVTGRLFRIAFWCIMFGAALSLVVLAIDLLARDVRLGFLNPDKVTVVWLAIAAISPVAVVSRLIHHRRIRMATLLGVIAAYLLIAVAFAFAFELIDGLGGHVFFADAGNDSTTSFMYFSLVTISTLGYGDLSAGTDFGRLVAVSEAVVGQVYLVTIVAMIVGLFIQQRDESPAPSDPVEPG